MGGSIYKDCLLLLFLAVLELKLERIPKQNIFIPITLNIDWWNFYPTSPGWHTCACSAGKCTSHQGGIITKSSEIPLRRIGSLLIWTNYIFIGFFIEGKTSARWANPPDRSSSPPYEQHLKTSFRDVLPLPSEISKYTKNMGLKFSVSVHLRNLNNGYLVTRSRDWHKFLMSKIDFSKCQQIWMYDCQPTLFSLGIYMDQSFKFNGQGSI